MQRTLPGEAPESAYSVFVEAHVPESIIDDRDLRLELSPETFSWIGESQFEVIYSIIARSAGQAHAQATRLLRAELAAVGIEWVSIVEVVVFENGRADAD